MGVKKKSVKKATAAASECHSENCHQQNPSHLNQKTRLNRIKGQIEGVDRMIVDNRYCLDIIYQIRAINKALQSLEKEIMHTHIKSCVQTAIHSKDTELADEKIQEIMDFF